MENNKDSGQYIWRTVQDDKVRGSHAARAGEAFSWTNPPEGGHPGEDFGCRCWAEAVAKTAAGLQQEIISSINDSGNKWTWGDFVQHFYKGRGKAVSLSQIGLFSDVVEHAESIIFERVESQIERLAQSVVDGQLQDTFIRPYFFGGVSFSLGKSTVSGKIKGSVKKDGKILVIEATVEYLFFDEFTDPISLRENRKNGTSSSDKADPKTELFGTAYDIVGRWLTKVTGTVKAPQ